MTPAEHYRLAEKLLKRAADTGLSNAPATIAAAHVHATLALAAGATVTELPPTLRTPRGAA